MNPREAAAAYLRQESELGFRLVYADRSSPAPQVWSAPPATHGPADKPATLEALYEQNHRCTQCVLSKTRNHFVFGEGNPKAKLLFIGEAPGADEDASGRPFIGKAGQLLTKMIESGMGLKRESVYIANIIKCRPPGNREPAPGECAACLPILHEQIRLIAPQFICCLGRTAARNLLHFPEETPLWKMRGKFFDFQGAQAAVTYHPSALLQHPGWKKDAWEDLQKLMTAMGLKIPKAGL